MEIYFFHFHTKNAVKKFISTSMRRELETMKYARKKKTKQKRLEGKWVYKHHLFFVLHENKEYFHQNENSQTQPICITW